MRDESEKTQRLLNQTTEMFSDEKSRQRLDESTQVLFQSRGPHDFEPAHGDEDDLLDTSLDIYSIRSLLGRGGMGKVYLAWHDRLHRLCAVKVITPGLVRAEPHRLEMFQVEARSAARLQHPNIVGVHSLGEDRGYHFIEMEFVEGPSLRRHLEENLPLSPLDATRFIAQLSAALGAAHRHNVVHCDIKPDNVMITESNVAKLTDFGLARIFSGGNEVGRMVGTPPYMAPELFVGQSANFASDIYALGVTYFSLLTGQVPIMAASFLDLREKLDRLPVPSVLDHRPDVPEVIGELIRSMMAKDAGDRPRSGDALTEQLKGIAGSLVDLRDVVREAMEGLDIDWQGDGTRFSFHVRLAAGRQQTVEAEVIDAEDGNNQILTFWTPCAPASPEHYGYVLGLNSRLPFGAVSIRDHNGKPYFVMTQNHPRNTIDSEEVRASVLHMAEWADHIEQQLTGKDVH